MTRDQGWSRVISYQSNYLLKAMNRYICYVVSDKGLKRTLNEDTVICDPDHGIFLVADGMGGENYGEVASQLASEKFFQSILPFIEDEEATIPFEHTEKGHYFISALLCAAEAANTAVIEFAAENKSHRGMGSTLTGIVYHENHFYVIHIGDSRLYRIRKECMEQITVDHTRVQEMVNKNLITPDEARFHPQRNIITRCVGRESQFQPDVFSIEFDEKDIFLICSDGLYDMVDDEHILRIVVQSENFEQACKKLVKTANENGGKDNISVVLTQLCTGNKVKSIE